MTTKKWLCEWKCVYVCKQQFLLCYYLIITILETKKHHKINIYLMIYGFISPPLFN